jgi:hypothetical protein
MMHNGGVVPYRERVRWPGWFLISVGFCLVAGYVVLGKSGATPTWAFLLAALPFLLVAYTLWRMRFLDLEFGPSGIGYGFGRLTHRVPKERILGAAAMDYPVARYMGWGYRLGWERGERAYSILGFRRGVLVRFTDEDGRPRKVFLSSRTPEAALAALDA